MIKNCSLELVLVTLLTFASVMRAAIITVNTTNNISPGVGETNLSQAIMLANTNGQPSNTISFNIPGMSGQVFYLETPSGGYPIITNNNVTIDGYGQPGASPNTNSLHAPNNAQIKICLDSRNGNGTDMGTITNFIGVPSQAGFTHDEWAVLGVFRGTNVHIKGLAILSAPQSTDQNATIKSISFARDYAGSCANWQVSGCWIGVDPADGQIKYLSDDVTVAAPGIAIAAYQHRDAFGNNPVYPQPGTVGVAAGSSNPRAEFNVIVNGSGLDSEGINFRIAGNFWGVLPDGMTNADFSVLNGGLQLGYGHIEVGRNGGNLIIGTDGDGVNDADEGNVFGGFANGGGVAINLLQNGLPGTIHQTNIIVAGNYFGVAIDGVARFAKASTFVDTLAATATVRIGSDFDGVSDALEGNILFNNHPFAALFPDPSTTLERRLLVVAPGARVSFRGNSLVNNDLVPFDYADGSGGRLTSFTNYSAPFLDATSPGGIIPSLSGDSTPVKLIGICPLPNATNGYTNVIIDVYTADPEGITNGQKFALDELIFVSGPNSVTNGFPQGKMYLGSFVENGPADLNPAAGQFEFDISSFALTNGVPLTVTANYSADPPGTHNGRTHTSNFANPPTAEFRITSINVNGSTITINWTGGTAPYTLQKKPSLTAEWGTVASGIAVTSTTDTLTGSAAFYRVSSP